jgi:hypothetical protein
MFAVPPGKVVVIEVALALEYENDEGNIEADFKSVPSGSPALL